MFFPHCVPYCAHNPVCWIVLCQAHCSANFYECNKHTCQPSRFSRKTPDIHYPLPFSSRCKKSPAILLISDKISCLPFSPLSLSSQQPVLQKRILFERARCYHGDVCRRSVVTAGATNQRRLSDATLVFFLPLFYPRS